MPNLTETKNDFIALVAACKKVIRKDMGMPEFERLVNRLIEKYHL